jgi:hypothetical protein
MLKYKHPCQPRIGFATDEDELGWDFLNLITKLQN